MDAAAGCQLAAFKNVSLICIASSPAISFYQKRLLCTHLDKYGSICQVKVWIIVSHPHHQIAALLSEIAQGGMPTERASEPPPVSSNWRVRTTELNHFITTYLIWLDVVSQWVNQCQGDARWHYLWHCFPFTAAVKAKCVLIARHGIKRGVMPAFGSFSAQHAVESATTPPHRWLKQTLTLVVFCFTLSILKRFNLHAITREQSKPRWRAKKRNGCSYQLEINLSAG